MPKGGREWQADTTPPAPAFDRALGRDRGHRVTFPTYPPPGAVADEVSCSAVAPAALARGVDHGRASCTRQAGTGVRGASSSRPTRVAGAEHT